MTLGCGTEAERAAAPGDPERRARFAAGTSAAEARALVETNNPANIDAVAAFFNNPEKPYAERLAALAALRTLRSRDAGEYRRVYGRVKDKLWVEVSHADGISMTALEEKAFVEAIGWHADLKDPLARLKLELYLDREWVREKRLPDEALSAVALDLAQYPQSPSARGALWAALRDPGEVPLVRAACLKALSAFHPQDFTERLLELAPAPGDEWLLDLQRKLR